MPNNGFKSTEQTEWTNFHQNVTEEIQDLFTTGYPKSENAFIEYNLTTGYLQRFINYVLNKSTTLRALGSGWSWTEINTTRDGIMLDTTGLDLTIDITKEMVLNEYTSDFRNLVLVQCGNTVRKLNKYLEGTNRSLKTSGASDGQTIVGAMSTGTHGSNFKFGSIQDFVVGMHIITGSGNSDHVWIEKESYKVVSDYFLQSLNIDKAHVIRDDDVFNSALVCFGSFGLINSILIETEDIYQIELHRNKFPFDNKLAKLMEDLDFKAFGFPGYNGQEPCHLEVVFDPYDCDPYDPTNDTGYGYVSYGYKIPNVKEMSLFSVVGDIFNDVTNLVGKIADCDPKLIPAITMEVLRTFYKSKDQRGTLGEIYTADLTPTVLVGTSMCIAVTDINKVLTILKKNTPRVNPLFAGFYSLRFVKKSNATLACTRFGDVTCVFEADGVYNDRTKTFYNQIWNELRDSGIDFTFHWGKLNDLDKKNPVLDLQNPYYVNDMYGNNVAIWKDSRDKLLPDLNIKKIFTNDCIKSWGLG